MTPGKWKVLFATYYDDLKLLSFEELQYGCIRYRKDADNKFFPTPGQLLEACKNPYDSRPRNYAPLDDLPPAMSEQDAKALIDKISSKYRLTHNVESIGLKEEILARPPIPYVPMTKSRRDELLSRLKRALTFRYEDPAEAAKYIAELPE